MYKKFFAIIAIIFLVGCSSSYKLQYKGAPGDMHQYKIDTNMDMSMEMMGNEMNFTTQVLNLISQKINQVDNEGNLTVSFMYDSLSFSSNSPQMAQAQSMVDEMFKKVKGTEFKCSISKHGKVLNIAEMDSLIPGQFKQMVNPRQTFTSISPFLPLTPVKIGDTWTSDDVIPVENSGLNMKVNTKSNFTLVGTEKSGEKELLKITYTNKMLIEGEGEQMGMSMTIEGDGEGKGHFLFDKKAGMIFGAESETEMDLTIAVSGAQNMTMPMTQFIKAKVSLVK
ncbi:MAG: DUF6263 family protein [Candidatus Zhuqueibacterota bacterium]